MKTDLFSRFTRTFKDSSLYAVSSLLNSAIGFLLLPILTFYYDAVEYGIYSLIISIVVILGGFFYLGASSSYARFIYDKLSLNHRIKIFSQTINLTLIGGSIMLIIILLFGAKVSNILFGSNEYFIHIILAACGSILGFFVAILHVVFQFEKFPKKLLIVSFLGIIVNFLITYILLVHFDYGILAPIYGILICNFLITTYLFTNYYKMYNPFIKMDGVSKFLKFGVQSSIAGILFYIVEYSDRIMINQILTTNEVGIYSLGYKLGLIINIVLVIPFSQAWAPVKMEFLNDKRQSEFTTKIISYYFLIGVILIFIATFFGSDIFDLLFLNRDYLGYTKIFPIIMTSIFMYGIVNISNIGLYKEMKLQYHNLVMIFALIVNIVINFNYLNQYGIELAAYSTLITYSIIALFVTLISNRFLKIKIEQVRVFSLIIFLLLLLLTNSFSSLIVNLNLFNKIIFSLIFFSILYIFWIDGNEKKLIFKLIKQKII